ncbi:MAG TPA: GxxExxY protein [Steroidobacteraceae bacterium]|nr:GxxExxY protein [Steroidobacteraceae bacterium]
MGTLVVDAAVQIHRELGSGLLEVVYEVILTHELRGRGLQVARQVSVPIIYRGVKFDEGFRIDLIVESEVVIELKCVEALHNAHKKQLLTYLRLSDNRLGYLLNFGAPLMKDGIIRVVNRLSEPLI